MKRSPLHALIAREASALASEALEHEEAPAQESIDHLKRLSDLAAIQDSEDEGDLRRRFPPLIAFIATAIAASILLLLNTCSTEVDLESRLTSVTFTLPRSQEFFDGIKLLAFEESRVACVSFALGAREGCPNGGPLAQIRIASVSRGIAHGSVSIDAMKIPAGARVTLSRPQATSLSRLTIDQVPGKSISIRLSVQGATMTTVRGSVPAVRTFRLDSPPSFVDLTVTTPVTLDLVPAGGTQIALHGDIPVTNLAFAQSEEHLDVSGQEPHYVSSVLSGAVFLDSINGKRVELRPFDNLRFTKSDGRIRTLVAESGQGGDLALRFHGFVEGMRSGTAQSGVSLMPSFLEWVFAQQPLALFWTSVLSVGTIIISVLRFLRLEK